MTREEAIKILKSKMDGSVDTSYEWAETVRMAIEALQNLSKPNNGSQDSDLISRQDALKPFCIAPDGTRIPEVDCDNLPVEFSVEFIKKHLLSLPSADRPTGEWVSEDGTPSGAAYSVYCSRCGQWSEYRGFFCLWCGAKMGGRAND